jgi:tetratricopeptide (TPR) repeat protein
VTTIAVGQRVDPIASQTYEIPILALEVKVNRGDGQAAMNPCLFTLVTTLVVMGSDEPGTANHGCGNNRRECYDDSLLGDIYDRNGEYREAVEHWTKALLLANDTDLVATLGGANTEEAVVRAVRAVAAKRLDRLQRNRESGAYVPAIRFAREHLRAGHQEDALKWLTLACEERNVYSLMIASDPFYDPLRTDQRFAKLLRRLKLDG